ncbi:serine/threonine protein kinase [Amycolatopsis sp. Hca4]|uniref:serine/threonine protein kinase n=1 Tax=Amycolatopsis sp. Hca4 TaxID=2742131 RepID=UPI0015914EEE|nr:serine/threonine protein kinase [Amycolatopsis sp. Hca4]QKV74241.1 serine/threonine protein kinase [Amycolatopsis sp. Hca4]
MIALLVKATRPNARLIAANPGDWGIDVVAGDLGGSVFVWQAKYFYPITKKSHQQDIRDSFKSVRAAAAAHGHKIEQWVLCLPSSMDAETDKWWGTWKKKAEKDSGIAIERWDESQLRTLLISPDAEDVRREYYEAPSLTAPTEPAEAELRDLDISDAEDLESALFIHQLHAAGHTETMSAKAAFFNAELLAREVVDKAVPSEVKALRTVDMSIHAIWESRFNDSCQTATGTLLPGLHTAVMDTVRAEHSTLSKALPCTVVHSYGMMHRIVEDRRAGWVRHWRQISEQHTAAKQDVQPQVTDNADSEASRDPGESQ